MIDSVPLIQNANDAQQINASIIAMKKASRELDEKIVKLNSLNSELDKKIAILNGGLNKEIEDRKEAINSLDVSSVGGSGKYISAISETDGKISATASDITSSVSSGNSQPVTSGGVANYIKSGNKNNPISDCNDATENGIYYFANAQNCPPASIGYNSPDGSGTLIVERYDNNWINQICQDFYGNGAVYIRSKTGGTWGDWQKVIRNTDVTESLSDGNTAPVSSNAIYWLRRGLFFDSGLLNLSDNQEKTVTLSMSKMYLFVNVHATNGQELIILNCYSGVLKQTRITHAYGGSDTVITNSGQNVTFKATGACRGHLLLLTDYTST